MNISIHYIFFPVAVKSCNLLALVLVNYDIMSLSTTTFFAIYSCINVFLILLLELNLSGYLPIKSNLIGFINFNDNSMTLLQQQLLELIASYLKPHGTSACAE